MTDVSVVKSLRYRMQLLKERSIRDLKERSMREIKDWDIDVYSLEWLNFTMNYNILMGKIDTGRYVKMSDIDRLSDILDSLIV